MRNKFLPLDAKVELITSMIKDLKFYKKASAEEVPRVQTFKFLSRLEDLSIKREARRSALKKLDEICGPIKKQAFDTRRVDQERDRNPRSNLQYWHRTEPFISDEDDSKVKIFGKALDIISDIREDFGRDPEWHESYARQLYDHLNRIIKINKADDNIYSPHVSYLEQLVYARYRLSLDDINGMEAGELRKAFLAKDDGLLKRGRFLEETGGFAKRAPKREKLSESVGIKKMAPVMESPRVMVEKSPQQALADAIFGNNDFRKAGENVVERTITITIKDSVVE